jgi:ATP-dependent Clp protease protease subunit
MQEEKLSRNLEDFGIYQLSDEIDDGNCSDAIRFILEANLNGVHDHLTLIINSGGGFVTSGFALIDVMEGSGIPVHTVGLGVIASMALNIFIAGDRGHRVLTPNTLIMSHQWTGGRWGKEHELIAQQKQDEIVTKQMIHHFVKHTRLTEANVKKHLMPPSDVFLTANEAKKFGICDIVKEFGTCLTTGQKKKSKR